MKVVSERNGKFKFVLSLHVFFPSCVFLFNQDFFLLLFFQNGAPKASSIKLFHSFEQSLQHLSWPSITDMPIRVSSDHSFFFFFFQSSSSSGTSSPSLVLMSLQTRFFIFYFLLVISCLLKDLLSNAKRITARHWHSMFYMIPDREGGRSVFCLETRQWTDLQYHASGGCV